MTRASAFSLIELSIVLVILGLLTGGILAGQSLIRASELRSVTTEANRYKTAVYSFRDKYFALPGDMTNATAFWGTQNPTPTTCQVTPSTSALTCNGNGDGLINSSSDEMYRFWQQLANAGLIEGTYNGVTGSGGAYHHVIGTNSPKSKASAAGWGMQGNTWTNDGCDYAHADNRFVVGAQTTNNVPMGAAFKPEEAWNIDTKMDDGLPGIGKVLTWAPGCNANCATTGVPSTAVYNLAYTTNACALIALSGTR